MLFLAIGAGGYALFKNGPVMRGFTLLRMSADSLAGGQEMQVAARLSR